MTTDWINIISIATSISAALLALWSVWIAKKSYSLALQQDKRRHLTLYCGRNDDYIKRYNGFRIYTFDVTITNKADAPNSLISLSLVIKFNRQTLIVHHVMAPEPSNHITMYKPISLPYYLNPNEAIRGYAIFQVQDELLQLLHEPGKKQYSVMLTDSNNVVSYMDALLLREVEDDEKN